MKIANSQVSLLMCPKRMSNLLNQRAKAPLKTLIRLKMIMIKKRTKMPLMSKTRMRRIRKRRKMMKLRKEGRAFFRR